MKTALEPSRERLGNKVRPRVALLVWTGAGLAGGVIWFSLLQETAGGEAVMLVALGAVFGCVAGTLFGTVANLRPMRALGPFVRGLLSGIASTIGFLAIDAVLGLVLGHDKTIVYGDVDTIVIAAGAVIGSVLMFLPGLTDAYGE